MTVRGQKAPSAKRCIMTCRGCLRWRRRASRQKAPSAKRCIKTLLGRFTRTRTLARQKAPSAKRCIKTTQSGPFRPDSAEVRKYRAPKGALRQASMASDAKPPMPSQKAPSAIRCIKTDRERLTNGQLLSQKASSAIRCIKTCFEDIVAVGGWYVRKHRAPNGAL